MQSFFVIDTSERLRAVSDPLRIQILFYLIENEYTGTQLADILGLSPSKVHYHLRELEQHGLIQVVRTEEKNGIVQKFFRDVALNYVVSDVLLPSLRGNTMIVQEVILNLLRMAMRRVYHAPNESFQLLAEKDENSVPLIYHSCEFKGTRLEIQTWLEKYQTLMQELLEINKKYDNQPQRTESDSNYELFYLVSVGFLTDQAIFNVDEAEEDYRSDDYKFIGDLVVRKRTLGGDGEDGK